MRKTECGSKLQPDYQAHSLRASHTQHHKDRQRVEEHACPILIVIDYQADVCQMVQLIISI